MLDEVSTPLAPVHMIFIMQWYDYCYQHGLERTVAVVSHIHTHKEKQIDQHIKLFNSSSMTSFIQFIYNYFVGINYQTLLLMTMTTTMTVEIVIVNDI